MNLFAPSTAIKELSFRLGELSVEVQQLKSKHKHIELEWEELYDKVRHQMSRMSRRAKADAKLNGDDLQVEVVTEPDDGVDPISRSILARRGHRRQAE